MAKKTVTFTISVEVDEAEIAPKTIPVWLYQFINRLNYEHPVKSMTHKNTKVDISNPSQVRDLKGLKHGRDNLVKQ